MRAPSSHMNGGSHKLNSWWDPPFMWDEGAYIYGTPGVSNNFPKYWWDPLFMWDEGACIYGTPGVPNNFPKYRIGFELYRSNC